LLRAAGIRANIAVFSSKLAASDGGVDDVPQAVVEWISQYFEQSGAQRCCWTATAASTVASDSGKKRRRLSATQTSLTAHFRPTSTSTTTTPSASASTTTTTTTTTPFIAPLYLQHQGHSRTVIGIERKNNGDAPNLLILDPSTKQLGKTLESGKLWKLRRSTTTTINKSEYEIVFVDSRQPLLLRDDERHLFKRIDSI
jgi:hypothetical protein